MSIRCVPCWFVFLCWWVALPTWGAKRPVTIADVISWRPSPPIVPIWAGDGRQFVYQEGGALKLYSVAEKSSKEWLKTSALEAAAVHPAVPKEFGWQNRRVSTESYQWFSNNKDLLAEVEGDLFVVHPDGKYEQITKTEINEEDPKLSPDNTKVLYRFQSNLFLIDLATKHVRQLTTDGTSTLLNGQLDWVYPEELDLGTATWWSPDSKKIAFLRFDVGKEFVYPQTDLLGERALAEPERYPQAGTANAQVKLGVISLDTGLVTWMDTGDTSNSLLARVVWLPDSSQLALERLSRVQDKLDLLFCDPEKGEAKPVLHEQSKTWINLADNLFFLKARPEFLWTSERSGFRHIYRYSNKGELLAQLTSGDWEVKSINAVDETGRKVYYTSSEASPLESHVYSVSFSGGQRARISQEEGVHTIHANADGSFYLDAFSSLNRPTETVLKNGSGTQLAVLKSADMEPLNKFEIIPSEIVRVTAPDGTMLYGRLIKPAGYRPGVKYPLIVDVYGGPGVQTVRNQWYGLELGQALAHKGYMVWQLDNRGSDGRGHAFEEPIYREMGTQEVADQRLGVEYLIKQGLVDPARIGITGWSYGGYMTIHSMLLAPDIFKVGVAGAPVTDWHNYDTIYTERYMGLPDENLPHYKISSNVENAAKLQGKLLIVHNIEDDNVLFQNTMQMVNALERANKPFVMQIYPQKTHGVSGPLRKPLMEQMTAFFDRNLKGAN